MICSTMPPRPAWSNAATSVAPVSRPWTTSVAGAPVLDLPQRTRLAALSGVDAQSERSGRDYAPVRLHFQRMPSGARGARRHRANRVAALEGARFARGELERRPLEDLAPGTTIGARKADRVIEHDAVGRVRIDAGE